MIVRQEQEALEHETLGPFATKANESRGRQMEEENCEFRTVFQRDRDRIIHSKSFRRLKHKTQVFLSPEGDHYRTRLTHTLEVSQISRTIARALRLNEDLTEAIAMGHDLGHTPFGHCGELELNEIHESGFRHNEQSLRVVDFLERRSKERIGLNLTEEVRDGILNHTGDKNPFTLEGRIVKMCDRIAYINHDIDDAIRGNVIQVSDIPKKYLNVLGHSHSQRINTLIKDVIQNSEGKMDICMSDEVKDNFLKLRQFMFEQVYLNKEAKREEIKARYIVKSLYKYFSEHPNKLPEERYEDYKDVGQEAVKDYIAGMTDRYAVRKYTSIYVPKFWT
ncbi:deoxyguanosinetriphosphate triphosphohydrolase [Fusibacter sp. JL216-2]|uniref:deoxyguanosinetriphosphate triphosphohydrolase n=1 Tax=Fusibacter sp. JL216-2 TaxID=3071453 RepID=UPI003D33DD4B